MLLLCFYMLSALCLHGVVLVLLTGVYNRWFDDELTADLCLAALLVELVSVLFVTRYLSSTDVLMLVHLGHVRAPWGGLRLSCVLGFDEYSGFFFGILTAALLVCFFFLAEYFDYDSGAGMIAWLSALFSQVALLYFCAFDVVTLLLCWELISLVSFFLVQHWVFRLATLKAGLKVFTYSQVGDLPFFLACFLLLARAGTSDLSEILPMFPLWNFDYVACGGVLLHFNTVFLSLLLFALFLKAAQFFFYPWLLDAMEAPVPISAQLHSSTLVIIGFYLVARFQLPLQTTPSVRWLFLGVGFVTVVGASCLAFMQSDGKRLLACSTASQLGYVIVALGLQLYAEAYALLTFCCCNKAATFIWFGTLMRRQAGLSDLRFVGGWGALTWLERVGLLVSLCNFTVWPGVFSWHVKGLFSLGYATAWSLPEQLGCELLQLTWFFSSLYLCALYVGLVLTSGLRGLSLRAVWRFTLRGVFQRATALRWRGAALFRSTLTLTPTFVALMWFAFLFLVYAPLSFGVVYVDLSFFDNSAFSVVSYY